MISFFYYIYNKQNSNLISEMMGFFIIILHQPVPTINSELDAKFHAVFEIDIILINRVVDVP